MVDLIDFDQMSNQQKKDYMIKCILKGSSFTDPSATTLDWSTSSMQLHIPSVMVLGFLQTLDFDRIIVNSLVKKHPKKCLI